MARSTLVRNLFVPIFFFGYPVPKIALFPIFTYNSRHRFAVQGRVCVSRMSLPDRGHGVSRLSRHSASADLDRREHGRASHHPASPRRYPAALPSIFTGLRIALPISIIVIVLTEMIGDLTAGSAITSSVSGTRFEFADVYAAILVIGACGFVLDRAMLWLRHIVLHWEPDDETGAAL